MPSVLLGLLAALCLSVAPAAAAQPFSFVALGDLPYGAPQTAYPPYRALIAAVNAARPDFTFHVGDIKSGSTRCSDEEFKAQLEHFGRYAGAVIYTPGDNEWADCHRPSNGYFDPLERLQTLRGMFFTPGRSLGQAPIPLENQSRAMPQWVRYIENARFLHREVLFVTLHIVGSNNNLATREPQAIAQFMERDRANIDWIQDAFALAATHDARAIVFAFQADVLVASSGGEAFPIGSGFRTSIGETLLPLAAGWGRPVLLINGDSHRFRLDRPFTVQGNELRNVARLTVPGERDVRAVKVSVTPGSPDPFSFELLRAP